jgi:hypothetical protein
MVTATLPAHLVEIGRRLCQTLECQAKRYAAEADAPVIRLDDASFETVIDPANGLPSYRGVWRDARRQKRGGLVLNSDGSYFAEYDVLRPHPDKPRCFVEAVTAWGRDGTVKTEPRLLEAP